jgi:hypothetical protein
MMRRAPAVLAALLVAAVVLLAVELGGGAIGYGSGNVASPCRPRATFTGGGLDGTIQQIVLDGLDGAACRLGTTREELVLSLAPGTGHHLRVSRAATERAVRAALLRAVDRAEQRGDLPSLVVPVLRTVIEHAPIEKLIEGGIALRDLLGL